MELYLSCRYFMGMYCNFFNCNSGDRSSVCRVTDTGIAAKNDKTQETGQEL